MSTKKRVLRVGCISLLLLGFVGYFAFSTLFFPIFEGKFKADVAGLIPRTVDVYLARGDLRAAFDKFPTLAVAEELEGNSALNAYWESPEWRELDARNKITATLEKAKTELAKLPLGLDVLDVAGGEEIALAANFTDAASGARRPGLESTEWAAYARVSRWGKLGVSSLRHAGLIGLDKQGIQVQRAGEIFTVSGGQLKEPIHITRLLDVVVAGTSRSLVEEAIRLENTGSEGSLFLAAPYADSIASVERNKDQRDIELQINVREMRERWGWTKPWPDPASQRFAPAFFGRLLPLSAVLRVLGIIDFDYGLSVDLSGEFSSELMTAAQERIYRAKGFDQDEVMDVASYVADDATLFAYLRGPIATILDLVVASLEPAAAENLNDMLRAIRFGSTAEFVGELDNALLDRIAFVVKPNDWGNDEDFDANGKYIGPPNDGKRVFAWAAIAWMKDPKKIEEIREQIAAAGPQIGMQGATPGSNGYFLKRIGGGLQVREFWSPYIPGTGHIAVLLYGDNLIVSNRYAMIDELVQNKVKKGSRAPLLKNLPSFQVMLQDSVPTANLLTWLNPRTGAELLLDQAKETMPNTIESSIDYRTKRRQEEAKVLRTVFGGKPRSGLTADEAQRLDDQVDTNLKIFRDKVIKENLPREMESIERRIAYLRGISAALSMIKLSPKNFKLSVRVETPYKD